MSRVWQIAAGDGDRDFADLFLTHGLACVGSHARIQRLAQGDLLILKRGAPQREWSVEAVGRVEGPYYVEPRLEDVEGWDLRHMVPVRWRVPDKPVRMSNLVRGTLKGVNQPSVQKHASELWDTLADRERTPVELPPKPTELNDEGLINHLIDEGVASGRAEDIQQIIWRIRRLAQWYERKGRRVSEHEIRTFLIVPLLLALGWPEQRINIEYKHADIALWDRPFSSEGAQLGTIIETKRLMAALDGGPVEQAKRYAARYSHCDRLVVSDGLRYKLLTLDRDSGDWTATAYAHLLKLRSRHPTDQSVAGASELFAALVPS